MCPYCSVLMNRDAGRCAMMLVSCCQSCAGQSMTLPPSTSEQMRFLLWLTIKSLGEAERALVRLSLCTEIGFTFLGMGCTTFPNNSFHLVTAANTEGDDGRSEQHNRGIYTNVMLMLCVFGDDATVVWLQHCLTAAVSSLFLSSLSPSSVTLVKPCP